MKILVLAPFCSLPGEPNFNRFLYLAKLLCKTHDVTLVTSKFRHVDKKHRIPEMLDSEPFSIVLIDEPGYQKNVSLSRVWSHLKFFINFKKWFLKLNKEDNFDIVYSAYPLISTNVYLGAVKKKFKYKLIIDIQDVWPESMSAFLPFVSKFPLKLIPFTRSANFAYKSADSLVAVSETYLSRARLVNKTAKAKVIYIGADSEVIANTAKVNLDDAYLHFAYIGTLSHSYDVEVIVKAFSTEELKHKNVFLHIIGDGPLRGLLESINSDNVKFHGLISYTDMISIMKGCDYLINPIKSNAPQSVTNKISDYIFLKKPIINSQTNHEVLSILANFPSADYKAGCVKSFLNAVNEVINLKDVVYDDSIINKFDRLITYPDLVNFIEGRNT